MIYKIDVLEVLIGVRNKLKGKFIYLIVLFRDSNVKRDFRRCLI